MWSPLLSSHLYLEVTFSCPVIENFIIKKKISKLKNNQFSKLGNIPFMTKSGGTKDHFRWVKVPGTTPY
jgi:hypothetical protein